MYLLNKQPLYKESFVISNFIMLPMPRIIYILYNYSYTELHALV